MKTFEVDGKKYILDKVSHKDGSDKIMLVPIPKDYDQRITNVAKVIAKTVDKEEWLKQVLYKLDLEYLGEIEKAIKKKKRAKAKRGCYEICFGKGKGAVPLLLTD